MPRCGNCKENHDTVLEIRECYGNVANPPTTTAGKEGPMWPPSEKQLDYLMGLQEGKELPENHVTHERSYWAGKERDEISAQINLLKSYPWKKREASDTMREYTMPEGRYAINPGATGTWRFYEVTRSDKPRWKGYTFIKQLVGAPGSYNKVDMGWTARQSALRIIEANPKQAMLDYGLQSGVCGRCHSPLTDPDSLARGIGPKCAAKTGWF